MMMQNQIAAAGSAEYFLQRLQTNIDLDRLRADLTRLNYHSAGAEAVVTPLDAVQRVVAATSELFAALDEVNRAGQQGEDL
jgi:hypothetical protein